MDSLPKLNKDASREMSFDFSPFMCGSEKRNCEVETPLEVMQEAIHKVLRERLGVPFEDVKN